MDPQSLLKPVLDSLHVMESWDAVRPVVYRGLQTIANSLSEGVVVFPQYPMHATGDIVRGAIVLVLLAFIVSALLLITLRKLTGYRPQGCYVVDFQVYDGFRPEWCVSPDEWAVRAQKWFNQDAEEITFCRKILARSGVGNRTHFSPGIAMFPPDITVGAARYEAEIVMFGCIDKLLARHNLKPTDIDVLVTNCSLFNPTPSLAAMIINHYKMREDIVSFNLAGMGCGASPIGVDLARTMLTAHPKKDALAIVLSMENITQNIYLGKEKPMLLANALFRMGGAAILLSKSGYAVKTAKPPKYQIQHLVRIHNGANTPAYTCVFQDVDKENKLGVRLDKNLMKVAALTLSKNLTRLGPLILPYHAQLEYAYRMVKQMIKPELDANGRPIIIAPRFKSAVQHVGIHAGGRAVIDAIQKALNFSDADVKPSRDVLYKYGNTSSSSIWYEVDQIEQTRFPAVGDKILLMAFGSGFKVNTMVLQKL